jgi:hypothetical protein
MNDLALVRPPPASLQFEVPDVMPKVCDANVELVVEARICAPGLLTGPKISDPRPQPAIPYQPPT